MQEYGKELEERLPELHDRVQSVRYQANPNKRIWIPKSDGQKRPIGIATLEDKIVQKALSTVLQQIYEEDFLGFSYGARPGRGQHNALDAVYVAITQRKVNWVLDAALRKFYDSLDHEWLMKFVEHRVTNRRILRLFRKFLQLLGVPGNRKALDTFRKQIQRSWLQALRRRSQKARSLTWERMKKLIKTWLPAARVIHPYPNQRLCV